MKYVLPLLVFCMAASLHAQDAEEPLHPFSLGPIVGFDFMTQEIRYGSGDADRVSREQSAVLPQFGLQAMYRIAPGFALLTEPAFGSFFAGTDEVSSLGESIQRLEVEKFHVLHLPLLLRKSLSDAPLSAYLVAGVDMMFFLAPHAAIRYTSGSDPGMGEAVEYEIPFSRLAVQAGFGVQWQRSRTLAITADLRYRSPTDDMIGGALASIGFPAHFGLRIGLRVHLAKRKPW